MTAWIRLMATMDGLGALQRQNALKRGLFACAVAAPLLLTGCVRVTQASYTVAAGQKIVPMALDGDGYDLTFYGMKKAIDLDLTAPIGTTFVANGSKKYRLPLDVGQRQNVYFDVQSDGTLVEGKPVQARRIGFLAQGLERPSDKEQSFETRIWSKAPNNKPYTPRLLAVQYRYALAANQQSMELNIGNLRRDPESQLKVQGKAVAPTLLLRAAAGQTFVFSPKATSLDAGDRVPADATFAKEYRVQMAPGREQALNFWLAEGGHVRPQRVTVQYSVAP